MKVVISEQMRKIDKDAEAIYGIPGIVLMENAGIKVYENIMKVDGAENGRVCFVCGKGNNGGDGLVAARHLWFRNKDIVVYMICGEGDLMGDAYINYNIAKTMGLDIRYILSPEDYENIIKDIKISSVVVDAIFGTGIKSEVTGLCRDVIDIINQNADYVISVDMPSGIDADSGRVWGIGVRADRTVTLALPKVGLYIYPGADYAGEVVVEGISIPDKLVDSQNIDINLLGPAEINRLFRKRYGDSNKGTYGRAYIIGGSRDMMGAVVMCIMSALKCGAGLVEAGVPGCIADRVAPVVPESIVRSLQHEDGIISISSKYDVMNGIKKSSAYGFGPGLSQSGGLLELVNCIIESAECPGVIDADGLNLIARDVNVLYKARARLVVTPHPGEMARLTAMDIPAVQSDRIRCARQFSKKYGVVTVLKGANSIVASPSGQVFINTTGNPGMAKGGSGDVLTGMIVSFMAQGMDSFDAAKAGVYLHGLAADIACQGIGEYCMTARDIIDFIPHAVKNVSE